MAENVTDAQLSPGGDDEPPPSGKEMPHSTPTSLSTSDDPPPPSGKEMPHTTPPAEEI